MRRGERLAEHSRPTSCAARSEWSWADPAGAPWCRCWTPPAASEAWRMAGRGGTPGWGHPSSPSEKRTTRIPSTVNAISGTIIWFVWFYLLHSRTLCLNIGGAASLHCFIFFVITLTLIFQGGGGGQVKGKKRRMDQERGERERERERGGRKGGGWGGQTYTQIQNRYWHWEQGPGTNLFSHCSGNHRCADFSRVPSSSNHRHFTEIPQESQMPQTQFLTSGLSFLMALKMVFTICTNTQTLQSIKTWGDVSFLMVLRMVFMICTDRQPLKSTKHIWWCSDHSHSLSNSHKRHYNYTVLKITHTLNWQLPTICRKLQLYRQELQYVAITSTILLTY